MAEVFVKSAGDIRKSIKEFNERAAAHEAITLSLLVSTTYWIYDPDADTFGPGKFVGLKGMTFAMYRTFRHEVSGGATRSAIERVLDDVFDPRPEWRPRLRAWGEGILGAGAFGNRNEEKWRFTSLRAKLGARAELLVEDEDGAEFPEGRLSYVRHRKRERSAALVNAKKKRALQQFGTLACEVCDFDFSVRYGDIGKQFIECHHTIPVSQLAETAKTRIEDVVLVCSNCHRMIHRRRPWLGIGKIKELILQA